MEVLITCYYMDEPCKHDAEQTKPDTKGHTRYDPIYMKWSDRHRGRSRLEVASAGARGVGSDC